MFYVVSPWIRVNFENLSFVEKIDCKITELVLPLHAMEESYEWCCLLTIKKKILTYEHSCIDQPLAASIWQLIGTCGVNSYK